ncbi:MAG: 4-alpha-glucanotransferase [Chlamydiales bacterium]|nr:4-alpha-glucanotransferase [Chlamydiales bacterium]MCH9620210.1 4-alpha-glucanotransferase [Chlamydiales bacterium]MCH9623075.1 4-alpha-glucanotransferase [Chlamydiales bacterium]
MFDQTVAKSQWEQIGAFHHHGICLPLFSIHSQNSSGIGEFFDLIPLIKWCQTIGFDVIQLLPLNDTGLGTSPYDAISAFALNPIHLSMSALPELDRIVNAKDKLKKIAYWCSTPRVKHHIVRELKGVFFKEYVPTVAPVITSLPAYKKFTEENHDWLEPFALFKALKENQYWQHWQEWPQELKKPNEGEYDQLLKTHKHSIEFHQIIQYLCFAQLKQVKEIASEHNVFLKGDIPILISRDSADVWHNRHLFNLDLSAGAPPDMYSRDGQNWGFPLYHWEILERSGYTFWKRRLEVASTLYNIYRIDHVVGFFRLWGIPSGALPTEGTFFPPGKEEWIPHGKKIMEMMLHASQMLPIGEDLGLVPVEVKKTLYNLGICGTKAMRWERDYNEGGTFFPLSTYEPTSMTTVSTHDTDTLQLWWKHFPKEAKLYSEFKSWDYKPFLTLERQKEILYDAHHSGSLFHINLLQEYLALFPELVSNHPTEERINIPGKILDTNWTYRFIPSVEQISGNEQLTHMMKEIIC